MGKCCGETEKSVLTLDHINNDGAEFRKNKEKKYKHNSYSYYKWLQTNNYPSGLQVLCMNCNFSKFINKGKCFHKLPRHLSCEEELLP